MVEFKSQVNNKIGLHLRAAGEFVKLASRFESKITVIKSGKKADGKCDCMRKDYFFLRIMYRTNIPFSLL